MKIHIKKHGHTLVNVNGFDISEKKITFLFGESGIGKSLASRAFFGVLDTDEFAITIDDKPYDKYLEREEIILQKINGFFVFQEPSTHLNPLVRLKTQMGEGSLSHIPLNYAELRTLWGGADRMTIDEILNVFPTPYRPSGGEKQRILLAMAFKKISMLTGDINKALFVFDEPTGNLDNYYRNIVLNLLFERYTTKKFTALFITHDYTIVSRIFSNHSKIVPNISFKEMVLSNGNSIIRDFAPTEFLEWLNNQIPPQIPVKTEYQNPIVTVQSRVRVHKRTLIFSSDPDGKKECTLTLSKSGIKYLKAPSGTGKTTLIKELMGLIPTQDFKMTINGNNITHRTHRRFWQENIWGKKMTMVFQHADEALNPNSTVLDTFNGLPLKGESTLAIIQKYLKLLFENAENRKFLNKKIHSLSCGQKQRLNLLRSLLLDTKIIFLDEPLNGIGRAHV